MSGASTVKAVAKSAFDFLCKVKNRVFSLLPEISLGLTTELLSEVLETGAQKLWDIRRGNKLLSSVSDSYEEFAENFAAELLDELYKNICDDVGAKVGAASAKNMSRAVLASFDALSEESIKQYSAVRRLDAEEAERLTAFLIGYKRTLLKHYYDELSVNDKAKIQTIAYITAEQVKRNLGEGAEVGGFSLYLSVDSCPECGSGSLRDLGDGYICADCGVRIAKQPNLELINSIKGGIADKLDEISSSLGDTLTKISDKASDILSAISSGGTGALAIESYIEKHRQAIRENLCRAATYDPLLRRFPNSKSVRAYADELLSVSANDPLALFFIEASAGSSHSFCNMLERNDFSALSDRERKIIALYSIFGIRSAYCEKASIDVYLQRYFTGDEYIGLYDLLCDEAQKLDLDVYNEDKPRDLFVMYISEDLDVVKAVVGELESLGVSCFYSERNVRHVDRAETHDYNDTLHRAMTACRAFLLISTEAARAADGRGHTDEMRWWIRRELDESGESDYLLVKNKKQRFELIIGDRKSKRCSTIDTFFRGFNNLGVTAKTIASQLLGVKKTPAEGSANPTVATASVSEVSKAPKPTPAAIKSEVPKPTPADKGVTYKSARANTPSLSSAIRDPSGTLAFTSAGDGELCATVIKGSEEIIIPDSFNGFSVTEVRAQDGVDLTAVKTLVIPKSVSNANKLFQVQTASGRAPRFPSLTKVTLSGDLLIDEIDNFRIINDYTFYGYTHLREVSGIGDVKLIGRFAFFGCTSLKMDFSSLTSLIKIGDAAFEGCTALRQPRFPACLESIGASAFKDCSGFKLAALSARLKEIGNFAFAGCTSLATLTVHTELERIGDGAFRNCTSLAKITLPLSLTHVGEHAFNGCSSLFIHCEASEIPSGFSDNWNSSGCPYKLGQLKVGNFKFSSSLLQENASAVLESCIERRLIVPSSNMGKPVVRVYVPLGTPPMKCVEEIHLPDTLTTVHDLFSRFDIHSLRRIPNFPNLKRVVMGNGITSISGDFWGCSSLSSITLPKGLTKIGSKSFTGCSSLLSVTIPDGVTVIGENAFADCRSLRRVVLPKGLRRIENGAFINCICLEEIIIPDGTVYIGENAFVSCNSLTRVHIPASVKRIKRDAFGGRRYKLTVTCEARKKPLGWSGKWIGTGATVHFYSKGV